MLHKGGLSVSSDGKPELVAGLSRLLHPSGEGEAPTGKSTASGGAGRREHVCAREERGTGQNGLRSRALTFPVPPRSAPFSLSDSCWFWEGWDLFKLKGERHEGSLGWRGGGGAERRAGFRAAPHRRPRPGTGRQTLQATL